MISVVIPLYNKVKYIKRALDSVLRQTYQDFEVIVVNDGSTDGSEKVVEQYNDPRIRLINQQNQGESAARNRGIAEAKGELIAFLDADDEWLPEHLAIISRLSINYPDCGMYATGRIFCRQGRYQEVRLKFSGIPEATWEGVIPNYFRVNPRLVCSSTVAVWKKIFEDVGLFIPTRHGPDLDMWARIALKYRVAFSATPSAKIYSNTGCNISQNVVTPIYEKLICTLDDVLRSNNLPDWISYQDILDYRNHHVFVAARSGLVNLKGYGPTARKMLQSAWKTPKLRAGIAVWYLMSFLPSRITAILWKIMVKFGRFLKRIFGLYK